MRKWQAEYDNHIHALEKVQYNPATEGVLDVDMAAEMEKARREIQEREESKVTGTNAEGEAEKPKMNIKGAKLGAVAWTRHQLTTLLTDACVQHREALEDKIAQARINRKEASSLRRAVHLRCRLPSIRCEIIHTLASGSCSYTDYPMVTCLSA